MTSLYELAQHDALALDDELRTETERRRREEAERTTEAAEVVRDFFMLPAERHLPLALRTALDARPLLWEVEIDGYDLVVTYEAGPFGADWKLFRRDRANGPEVETPWIPAEQLQRLNRAADLLKAPPPPDPLAALHRAEDAAQRAALNGC